MYEPIITTLFTECYNHFLDMTYIPQNTRNKALNLILDKELYHLEAQKNQDIRAWFNHNGAIPWIEPQYFNANGDKPATYLQQLSYLMQGVYNLYYLKNKAQFSYDRGQKVAAVDARQDCELHKNDQWKIVNAEEYLKQKPMRMNFDCQCWLDWAPETERAFVKWEERIARYRDDAK